MAYEHNYILYNYVIILTHYFHELTYLFPHNSNHSFHQFQAPNTWIFLVHFTQTRDCFIVPKQSKWAVHGQPTHPTSVPIFETDFHGYSRSHTYQHTIKCLISHTHSPTSFWTVTDSPKSLQNSYNFGSMF